MRDKDGLGGRMTIIVTTSMTCKVRESISDIIELIERKYIWFELKLAEGEDTGKKLVIRTDTILYYREA